VAQGVTEDDEGAEQNDLCVLMSSAVNTFKHQRFDGG